MEHMDSKDFRAGYVTIIGLPNVGKSTLLNSLLDIKLSIISPRPQTTRKRILGILNGRDSQIVFLDTPGVIRPRYNLQSRMMDYVDQALNDADLILYLADSTSEQKAHSVIIQALRKQNVPVILLLNKIDLVEKAKLLTRIEAFKDAFPFKEIIPISALKQDGIDRLHKAMLAFLPAGPPFYPPDQLTDQPERFFVAEIIREKVFEQFREEVPYAVDVQIEEFKERPSKKDYIYAIIFVERKSQKGILIGQQGKALKKVGAASRKDIEHFLSREVYLDLHVKLAEDWRKDEIKLKRLGY
ncbi:MAG: GTPase Era [Caldithrix sp.]|nr:GTPase Era [Caldithrix sp.]